MVSRVASWIAMTAAVLSAACKPDIIGRPSAVEGDRVLAVRSSPAELKPGQDAVTYEALYVGANGAPDPSKLDWSFCTTPKPLAVTGPIAPVCLAPTGKYLQPVGRGASVSAPIPNDACKKFGPFAPDPEEGQPPGRPTDPDTTGGYYQPVRVLVSGQGGDPAYAVGVTRLDCGLSGATPEQSAEYGKRYRANRNPSLDSLVLRRANKQTVALEADPAADATAVTVAPRETVTLLASWKQCPSSGCGDGICSQPETQEDCPDDCVEPKVGCTGAEAYFALDPIAHALSGRREAMRVSWFATDGEYQHDRTGRTEDDSVVFSENDFTAPAVKGRVSLWVVLRDDRGGVGFSGYQIDVEP